MHVGLSRHLRTPPPAPSNRRLDPVRAGSFKSALLVALLALGLAGCASTAQVANDSPATAEPAEASTPEKVTRVEGVDPPQTTSPTPTDEADTPAPADLNVSDTSNAPDDLAHTDSSDEGVLDSDLPQLCIAQVPADPSTSKSGAVTYSLTGPWAQYSYGAIYVLNAAGTSALDSGEPAVRNGDSFAFELDDSMLDAAGNWTILSSVNGELTAPCEVRVVETVVVPGGGNSAGY